VTWESVMVVATGQGRGERAAAAKEEVTAAAMVGARAVATAEAMAGVVRAAEVADSFRVGLEEAMAGVVRAEVPEEVTEEVTVGRCSC